MEQSLCPLYLDNETQLNNKARKVLSTIKSIGKFFVALFLYFVLNVALCVLFNSTKSVSVEIFNLVEKGLRAFLDNNMLPAISFIFQMRTLPSIYIWLVMFCMTVLTFFVLVVLSKASSNKDTASKKYHQTNTQSYDSFVKVKSYTQHVQFLS